VADVKDPVAVIRELAVGVIVGRPRSDAARIWRDGVMTALSELERRARVERRLEEWLREEGALRTRTQSNVSVKLKDYRADREWFAVREGDLGHADDWTLLDAALDSAGAPKESE
jgi:hypothetical protein